MSTSLIAVFIPFSDGGIVGRPFREFAVVLAMAIAVSLCGVAHTTPMMCARFLKSKDAERGRPARLSERVRRTLPALYASLRWVLRHPRPTAAATILTIGLNVVSLRDRPQGLLPSRTLAGRGASKETRTSPSRP